MAELELLPATWRLVNEVVETTGFRVEFMERAAMGGLAHVLMAASPSSPHRIFYGRGNADRLNHSIAHECAHVLRMWELPVNSRVNMAWDPDAYKHLLLQFPRQTEEIIALYRAQYGEAKGSELARNLFQGRLQNVTEAMMNIALDIRIEHWLNDHWSDLHSNQCASLVSRAREVSDSCQEPIPAWELARMAQVHCSIQYALVLTVSRLCEEPSLLGTWPDARVVSLGETLVEVGGVVPSDAAHDVELVNEWAELLKMRVWFSWKPFDTSRNDDPDRWPGQPTGRGEGREYLRFATTYPHMFRAQPT